MKKFCKVKVDGSICHSCLKNQMDILNLSMGAWHDFDFKDCKDCEIQNREYELVKAGKGSFLVGDYAMVQRDGRIFRVPLDEVYDIQEVPDETKNL